MNSSVSPLRGCRLASAFALAVIVVSCAIWVGAFAGAVPAWAYFSKPAPSISVPASISLYSGDTQQVTCAIDPLSERQLPGCGMAECPQACDGLENPQTGVVGGCLNAEGWCTCAGTMYSTVQTSVSVSSSNPSVARASWSGGVLSVSGYRAGSVTLSVSASLAKHESAVAQVQVEVVAAPTSSANETAADSASTATSGSGSTSGTTATTSSGTASSSSNTKTGSSKKTGSSSSGKAGTSASSTGSTSASGANSTSASGSGSVSASTAGQTTNPAVEVVSGDGQSDEQAVSDVVRIDSREGQKVILARAGIAESAQLLAEVAGTDGRVTFWSGGTSDSPDVSVTYYGKDLSADGIAESFDSSVKASKRGSADVAALLPEDARSIVVELAAAGKLPAPAEVYVRTSAVLDEQTAVGLYRLDAKKGVFAQVESDVKPSDAYASFSVEKGGAYVLCKDDLTEVSEAADADEAATKTDVPAEAEASATSGASPKADGDGTVDATKVDVHAKSGTPYLAAAGVVCAAAVAGAATYFAMRRKKVQ